MSSSDTTVVCHHFLFPGRDGLTHNMLELIHSHWKRQEVCKFKCKGVPTVDMDNVCRCIEDKRGGKIIHRAGGTIYLFRGRNYNYRLRPQYPVMLWKPATPVYPKPVQDAHEGLTREEADKFRRKGKTLLPICKLAKNGVYISLVKDVRQAFEGSELVKIDCRGLDPSDYKRIGAKLMELVPSVLLSFEEEQILMWRGRDWKTMYPTSDSGIATVAGVSQIKALSGAPIGGEDILKNMMHYLVPDLDAKFSGHGLNEIKAMASLRISTQNAIHILSSQTSAKIEADLGNGRIVSKVLDRKEFENVNKVIFEQIEILVKQFLHSAKIENGGLTNVILVGGCSLIPKIRDTVKRMCQTLLNLKFSPVCSIYYF